MLLGYRKEIRKSAMSDQSLAFKMFLPLHSVKGFASFL